MSQEIIQPKPSNRKYNELISDIQKGIIKIPKFQRDFVWDVKKSADLLDSILKGYPIGTFIFWKTNERLKHIKNLGDAQLDDTPTDESVQYVLDGQQRLASLYAVTEGLKISKGEVEMDYKNIYIDLDKFDEVENIVTSVEPSGEHITVNQLLIENFTFFTEHYDKKYHKKIQNFIDRFKTYDFSAIVIDKYPIEKAVDIFNRINTAGQELSLFEIMVAKTYDDDHFDLYDKTKQLNKDLNSCSYEIPKAQLLQCISINLKQECTRKVISHLSKEEVIDNWNDTSTSIKAAIDHFKNVYLIPASNLLPYPALIVPFSYFFFKNKKQPTFDQDKKLQEYFWKSSLTSRFNNAVESKLAYDGKIIDKILENNTHIYDKDFKITLDKNEIKDLQFKTKESLTKAVMCVLAFQKPKSFRNNTDIILDNSYLIQSNSKNYHHFFPKAFLKKQGVDESKINLISNITLIDDFLNKREIKDKPPSQYMKKFKEINENIDDTMKTHLIDDLDEYGIWTDDFEKFIEKRAEKIWLELEKRF